MSLRIRYFFAFLIGFSFLNHAQSKKTEDAELIKMQIDNYLTQADFDMERGDYYNSKINYEYALTLAQQNGNRKSEAIIYTRISKVQVAVEEPEKALVSLTKAAEIQREIDDDVNLAITYNERGLLHESRKEYDTALQYFKSAKSKFENQGLETIIPEVELNEAKVLIELNDYKTAKSLLEKTIILAKKHQQTEVLACALIQSGKVQHLLGNDKLAIELAKEGLILAESDHLIEVLNASYLTLSDIYQSLGDYKQSSSFLRKHLHLSDSILNIRRDNLLPENRVSFLNKYNLEKSKQMEDKLEAADVANSLTRITTILSIALITILSLLTLSLYKNNNIRLKTNVVLRKKNEELIVAKEKAELASKTKANFLSTVTHELRTPLYAVTGLTNMLLDEDPKADQIPHLKSLRFSGEYLLTFINDILQVNKIEANKVDLDPELFNLRDKVENVVSALNNSALDNNVILHFEYDDELPDNFIGDQLKISQILINLVGNAIKFTHDGDIWVRVIKIDQSEALYNIRFEIQDNGIGITKEKQEHMFESFSQGSIQINRKYGGTGLGLSIVKGLIDILKGNIYLKSELGKGSVFTFEVPLIHSSESVVVVEPKKFNEENPLDLSQVKILVVEDNKINQMITKKILSKMNLYCDVVDNGEEAISLIKDVTYDIVLMDIHMPGISGLEATKIIRTFDKDLTIFALTAVTIEDKMQEFEDAGFTDIIPKPFKQEDFEKKIYDALVKNHDNLFKLT